MASLAPTQPEARALPSLSHHRLCTSSGSAPSLKPGPGAAWSCWPRSRAVAPCAAAAPLTQRPTSASTLTLGAGAGAGAEPRVPLGLMGRPPMRRTGLRSSAGPLSSRVCSVDCSCLGMGVRSWASSESLRISLCGHLCLLLCVLCNVSVMKVLPDRHRLPKEQKHRPRKLICACCSLTRFCLFLPLPWGLTTGESEAPGPMRAAD